jgi:hypothetical protein
MAVELVERAVSAVATVDVDALSDAELHDHVVGLQRLTDRLVAATAALVQRWDARQAWADDGSRSASARLARETGSAESTCARTLRRSRSLASMPATTEAAITGLLSLGIVELLAHANTPARRGAFMAQERWLIDTIAPLRYRQAVRAVRYWCERVDAELAQGSDTPADPCAKNRLHASTTINGTVVIDGVLDAIGGAIVTSELQRLINELRGGDDVRTLPQLRAAALVEMAHRSTARTGDVPRAKPLLTVLVGDESFRHMCELSNGTVLTPTQLVPWLTDAMFETMVFDGPTTVISKSRARAFAGALRRAIEVRDRHCQHPSGCDVPADECDADHIVPWSEGGETSQWNGRLQCTTHNRNAERHDHGAVPAKERSVDRFDELRALIRWRHQRDYPEEWERTSA